MVDWGPLRGRGFLSKSLATETLKWAADSAAGLRMETQV